MQPAGSTVTSIIIIYLEFLFSRFLQILGDWNLSQWMFLLSNFRGHRIGFLIVTILCTIRSSYLQKVEWTESKNLDKWYTPLDMCLLLNDTALPIESIMQGCEAKIAADTSITTQISTPLKPMRCRAGNSWPSKGGFCSPVDIPYSKRENLRNSIQGYDDPSQQPLKKLFHNLGKENGALLLIG
jgi:hypothetical protein